MSHVYICTDNVDYKYIVVNNHLSAGEFGIVYRGRLDLPGSAGQEVAIKTLKGTKIIKIS